MRPLVDADRPACHDGWAGLAAGFARLAPSEAAASEEWETSSVPQPLPKEISMMVVGVVPSVSSCRGFLRWGIGSAHAR